jgi:tyramine---L-glutamate ligase
VKILIFEYLTGGGFCASDLPASLAHEGGLMREALLNDFSALSEHEIVLLLDERCITQCVSQTIRVIPIKSTDDVFAVFVNTVQACDAVWIIAPETEHILFNFTQQVEVANKLLLSAPSSVINVCADKLQTFHVLTAHHIPTIPTQRLSDLPGFKNLEGLLEFPLVIKPIDGVGGENSFFIQHQTALNQALNQISSPQNYIIQPFIKGDALSLSAIFKYGQAQLICVNRQLIEVKNQQFKLTGCEINLPIDKTPFEKIVNQIAAAFPNLFGYIGIDLILSDLIYVVEINPRLTSSYAGIHQALGINIAELVLAAGSEMAKITPVRNQTIFIETSTGKSHAL